MSVIISLLEGLFGARGPNVASQRHRRLLAVYVSHLIDDRVKLQLEFIWLWFYNVCFVP